VYTKETQPENLPSVPSCKYGDRVKLEKNSSNLGVIEIAITGYGEETLRLYSGCYTCIDLKRLFFAYPYFGKCRVEFNSKINDKGHNQH
jgi:hypothetical protein